MSALPQTTTTYLLPRDGEIKKQIPKALAVLYCATAYDIARYIYKRLPTDSDLHVVRRAISMHLPQVPEDPGAKPSKKKQRPPVKHPKIKQHDFHGKERIFGLTKYGAAFMRDKGYEDARDFEIRDLDHEHDLTLIQLAFIEFTRDLHLKLDWKRPIVNYKKRINPDAVATIQGETWELRFIIEVERQTFNENYMKKAKKFMSVFDTDEAEELFGDRKFRVLFATESDQKARTVLKHYHEEYNHKMFWLTTIPLLATIPSAAIFQTPKDYTAINPLTGQPYVYSFLDIFPK
jgi:hypothetical protein